MSTPPLPSALEAKAVTYTYLKLPIVPVAVAAPNVGAGQLYAYVRADRIAAVEPRVITTPILNNLGVQIGLRYSTSGCTVTITGKTAGIECSLSQQQLLDLLSNTLIISASASAA